MLRWLTAGESHGPALVTILEGVPAGVAVSTADIAGDLARRRLGYGRGARMSFERDEVEILGGVRHGLSLGSPIAIRVGNSEWPKWHQVMAADPVPESELDGVARNAPLTRPRPGHADLAGMQKYGFDDARPDPRAGERARDGREGRRSGSSPRRLLRQGLGVEIVSPCGRTRHRRRERRSGAPPRGLRTHRRRPAALCRPARRAGAWSPRSTPPRRDADTLGGIVEVLAYGLPPGLGSHVHWDRKLRRPDRGRALFDSGHQGGRDRGRVHPGPSPRIAGARRDRAHRGGRAAAHRSGRWARGRHDAPASRYAYARR